MTFLFKMLLRKAYWSLIITQARSLHLTQPCLTIPTLSSSKPRQISDQIAIPMKDPVLTLEPGRLPNHNRLIQDIDLRTLPRLAVYCRKQIHQSLRRQLINIRCPFSSLRFKSWPSILILKRCLSHYSMWAKGTLTIRISSSLWVKPKSYLKLSRTLKPSWPQQIPIIQVLPRLPSSS